MTGTVLYEVADAVATITLNRPESLNSFDAEMRADLVEATTQARNDADVRAVIVTGAGRCFSAGADLKAGFKSGEEVEHLLKTEYKPSLVNIAEMEKPVISAINGFAAGIGLSYALACDLSIMAESAFLLVPFSAIGLVPDGGSTWMLANSLGHKRAFELAIENDRMPAQKCVELGLVNRQCPDADLMDRARDWAAALAKMAPLALARTKKLMREAGTIDLSTAIDNEAVLQHLSFDSKDSREGITAFLEKREPNFSGE